MEPEEYIEYVEDTIFSLTPKLGKRGSYTKVSSPITSTYFR